MQVRRLFQEVIIKSINLTMPLNIVKIEITQTCERLKLKYLNNITMFVTLEPCAMCKRN